MTEAATQDAPKKHARAEEDVAARKRARTREQLELLMAASFCTRVHARRVERAASAFPALEERRRAADEERKAFTVDEGDPKCPECENKLSSMSAALVLVLLPATATDKLVHAAKSLQCSSPMLWSFIRRAHFTEIERIQRRAGQASFTANDYQAMASELLEALPRPAA